MGLTGALQIGRSALLASQAALEVVGNNLANVATRGYHRQEVALSPLAPQQSGSAPLIGRGVQIDQIIRQIDEALESRLRGSLSDQAGSSATRDVLAQLESIENQLDSLGNNLTGHLEQFFAAWTQLEGHDSDPAFRNQILVQAEQLTSFVRSMRDDFVSLRDQVDDDVNSAAMAVDDLLTQIDALNIQIVRSESGRGGAHTLRDQRDQLLGELSTYMDISTNELDNGMVDVFVGSIPVILNGQSRGVELERRTVNGETQINLRVSTDGSLLEPTSGKIGALIASRDRDVSGAIDDLDQFTSQLIWQVNRIHTQGQGLEGFTSLTADNIVADPTAVLNSADTGLDFLPQNGSFQITVRQRSTGAESVATIKVNLNGDATDTTLNSLVNSIDNVVDLSASIGADGRLTITTSGSDVEFYFGDDTSGALAALGLNTFFSGNDAMDVDVRSDLNTTMLAVARGDASNGNALEMGALQDQDVSELGNVPLAEFWNRHVTTFAARHNAAIQQTDADTIVRQNLEAQQQSVSGVNVDEEAINLLTYQRAYQGSARFLTVVDELMQTLLGLV